MKTVLNLFILLVMSACNIVESDVTPIIQRADIHIGGDFDKFINLQSDEGLIEVTAINLPVSDEYHIDINIGDYITICFVVNDMFLDNPIQEGIFSAYSHIMIEDKSRYVNVSYISNGDILYSSLYNAPPIPQVNVFEITDDTSTHLYGRINNLTLYSSNQSFVTINGTFKFNY